jgi:hypothetical protein
MVCAGDGEVRRAVTAERCTSAFAEAAGCVFHVVLSIDTRDVLSVGDEDSDDCLGRVADVLFEPKSYPSKYV